VITNEQRERILATYRQWIYGYKRLARELGLTRDQVRQVIVTTANQRRRKQMTSFEPNDYRVKKANSAYEDRDLSGYATDAEKIAYLQDENRLLRALLVEYQKEFLPEALSAYPMFQSKDEIPLEPPSEGEGKGKEKKPKRSLKKKPKRRKEA
jgi:transposase-like protein